MQIEYEAKFLNIDKDDLRRRLAAAGAALVRPEFLQKRIPFDLPGDRKSKDAWLRVRDEDGKVTLSLKIVDGDRIEDQREIMLTVDDFDNAVALLDAIGCGRKSYQETRRELWHMEGGVDVTLDKWPFLEPFMEVEGPSEEAVRAAAEKLGCRWEDAVFGAVGKLYFMKYGMYPDAVNQLTKIVFDMENPFTPHADR